MGAASIDDAGSWQAFRTAMDGLGATQDARYAAVLALVEGADPGTTLTAYGDLVDYAWANDLLP